ncbi:MAG: hypothetical protein [Bacteriophage sp.]|nr:MAG: hypothetical protein [Bacteriophage sp.]
MNEAIDEIFPTVEQWLSKVSYKEDPDYVPSLFALEFITFIKLVNGGEGEENKTPVLHMRMLDTLVSNNSDQRRIANMVFRGSGKTTVLGEYLFLYIAVYGKLPGFGKINLALYVSDSIENGVKNMRKNLEYRWSNSAFLQKYLPKKKKDGTDGVKFTDIRWEFTNIMGNTFIIKGYGAKTGVRGSKEQGTRPQLAVLDDLLSDEDARSSTVIASIEDTVYKAIDYALHPKKNMIVWSGTPFNAKDPLYKAVESGAWEVNVYPVCESFPVSEEEFVGAWPDRFNYKHVEEKYRKSVLAGKVDTFNQELMLRIMSDEDRMVLDSDIQWYQSRNFFENRSNFNFYITTDFATTSKTANDFSVISVWAYNNNGDWFWCDGVCVRQDMNANINDLFTFVSKWKPMSVGIEVSGQQGAFVDWIQSEMNRRNIYFNLASDSNSNSPGIRPLTNKIQRFHTVVPLFKLKKMYFPKEKQHQPIMLEMYNEVSLASPSGFRSKKDDFLDTISMLGVMKPFAPSGAEELEYNDFGGYWGTSKPTTNTSPLNSYLGG